MSWSIIGGQRGDFQVVPFERRNEMTSSLGTHQRWQLAESLIPHTWRAWEDVNETVPRAAMQTKVPWCEGVQTGPGSEWWGTAWCEAGESSFNSMHSNGTFSHPWTTGNGLTCNGPHCWILAPSSTPSKPLHDDFTPVVCILVMRHAHGKPQCMKGRSTLIEQRASQRRPEEWHAMFLPNSFCQETTLAVFPLWALVLLIRAARNSAGIPNS